jgi:hypothetical protein
MLAGDAEGLGGPWHGDDSVAYLCTVRRDLLGLARMKFLGRCGVALLQ